MKSLWLDESGALLSAELILLLVIVVIGLIVGMVALRDQINAQLVEVGTAIAAIDPGYFYSGVVYTAEATMNTTTVAEVNGSAFVATVLVDYDGATAAPATVLVNSDPAFDKAAPDGAAN